MLTGKLSEQIEGGPPIKTCGHTRAHFTPLSTSLQIIYEVLLKLNLVL